MWFQKTGSLPRLKFLKECLQEFSHYLFVRIIEEMNRERELFLMIHYWKCTLLKEVSNVFSPIGLLT